MFAENYNKFNIHRIDRNLDGSQMSKLASKDSSRDIAESETDKDAKTNGDAKPSEPPPILKYIKTQVINHFKLFFQNISRVNCFR